MLLTELKQNLKEYLYMFQSNKNALNYLYARCGGRTYTYYMGCKIEKNPRITKERFHQVINSINDEIAKNAVFVLKGLSESLGISETDFNLELPKEASLFQNERVRSAGVGAVVATVFAALTGGASLAFSGFGALAGAVFGGDKFVSAGNMLYENDKKAGDYLYKYFSKKIDILISAGQRDTIKVPEYCIYDAKNICELCGKKIIAKKDYKGWYMGCIDYPRCTYRTKYRPIPKINRSIK